VEIEHGVAHVRAVELLRLAGLRDLARIHRERWLGGLQAAHARPVEHRLEPQPERVAVAGHPRDVEPHCDQVGPDGVALAAELERVDRDVQVKAPTLPRGQPEPAQIEAVSPEGHRPRLSPPGPVQRGPAASGGA
jgi:hypothetical protein